jgi:hypothetical protein
VYIVFSQEFPALYWRRWGLQPKPGFHHFTTRAHRSQALSEGEEGNIEWGKVWKLAKMAFKYYVRGEHKL